MGENETIGTRLYNLRERKGQSLEVVAEAIGISHVTLCRYENGHRMPKMDILAKLAVYYQVSIDFLIHGDQKCEDEKDGQADGNISAMLDQLSRLAPEDQQKVVDFVQWIFSNRKA